MLRKMRSQLLLKADSRRSSEFLGNPWAGAGPAPADGSGSRSGRKLIRRGSVGTCRPISSG